MTASSVYAEEANDETDMATARLAADRLARRAGGAGARGAASPGRAVRRSARPVRRRRLQDCLDAYRLAERARRPDMVLGASALVRLRRVLPPGRQRAAHRPVLRQGTHGDQQPE